ncbi:MAG: uracil-DNA glycosylase [Chloroflexi bacterium]|nr:uracil-DNA glycosylase [Chloroflexota bacterium]
MSEAAKELETLNRQITACQRCPLGRMRNRAVPGEGPADAQIMFIGEAPGFHEDRQGRPFVGAAGKFLDELLASINMKREDVFIANVIKCRPPGNRDPQPDEIAACRPYLDKQIDLIQPRIIITLGRFSMARYFPGASISRIHGQPKRSGGRIFYPMFHPAAALHQPRWRPLIEEDMKRIPELLEELEGVEMEMPEPEETYEQLSLF